LFADRWPGTSGFGAWTSSDPIHAVGGASALGPYTDKGYAYNNGSFGSDPHHGHNSEVVTLLDGTYGLIVSEVVPFTVFTSSSLDGPWTPCSGSPGAGLSVPAGFGGNTSYASNVSLVVRPDGNFEIIQRHGLIALSTTGICGPYKAQQPTNTYPSSEAITAQFSASIYPNRQKHLDSLGPSTVESTYTLAEDPVIWFSGGQYHVLYDYPDDRVGYHLTSSDGIHNWTDQGLAYDPRYAQQIFSYTDGTVDHWYKMERPGILIENGHVTHVTFAVSDVDKNNQIAAGSNHGSKVIVVPFDGVTFDSDTGVGGSGGTGGTGGSSGTGGATGSGGRDGGMGGSGSGGATGTGGRTVADGGLGGNGFGDVAGAGGQGGGSGGATGSGGRSGGAGGTVAVASGGADGSGGAATGGVTAGSGGGTGTGGTMTGAGGYGTGGTMTGAGGHGTGGLASGSGGTGNGSGGQGGSGSGGSTHSSTAQNSGSSGCSCATQGSARARSGGWVFGLGFVFLFLVRRRKQASADRDGNRPYLEARRSEGSADWCLRGRRRGSLKPPTPRA
jgi:MYXO-CTERM domain-containing protein